MVENWLHIEGFVGCYEVSDQGRVKSLARVVRCNNGTRPISGRILKPQLVRGYFLVGLRKNGKLSMRTVHRLVIEAFTTEPETEWQGRLQINHINGKRTDNRLNNLEFCTPVENTRHGAGSILALNDVIEIRRLLAEGKMLQREIAELFGVARPTISQIKCRRNWNDV